MDIKENFAKNLSRYRKHLNLTQAEFAEKIANEIATVNFYKNKSNKSIHIKDIKSTQIFLDNGTYIITNGYLDIGLNDTMQDLSCCYFSCSLLCHKFFICIRNMY